MSHGVCPSWEGLLTICAEITLKQQAAEGNGLPSPPKLSLLSLKSGDKLMLAAKYREQKCSYEVLMDL